MIIKNPISCLNNKIWDEHNRINHGVADYYHNSGSAKSWDFYSQILEYNNNNPIQLNSDDIQLIVGIYDNKYFKRKEQMGLQITPDEYYPSILTPYGKEFIHNSDRGMEVLFTFNKKIQKIKCLTLNAKLIKAKENEIGFHRDWPALCFILDYDSNKDLLED